MIVRTALFTGIFALALAVPAAAADFAFGADLSFANEMDDCGAIFKDSGKPGDVYAIMKAHGTNVVRIRLWNNPDWTKYSTLDDVKKSIARAKANGMKVLLDFHYSDDWADANKQIIPAAWAKIKDDNTLAKAVYQFTYDTLRTLAAAGLEPDYVQIGNETNVEVMLPDTPKAPINWERNAKLLNAGIKATRAADKKIKVMLHIAQPENAGPWFEAAAHAGVTDFDVIGLSYYSEWSKKTLAGLGAVINQLRYQYAKDIWVVETAYAWTLAHADNFNNILGTESALPNYSLSKDGQKQYLVDLTQTIIANGGSGLFYWAPDWVSTKCKTRWGTGSSWENATLFDFDGNALPALDYPKEAYKQPVPVTFKFRGTVPGQAYYLWGDFLGSKTFAVRLPADGVFSTTMMAGKAIRFQVFDSLSLHTKLLTGEHVVNGFAAETIPANGTTFEYDLVKMP